MLFGNNNNLENYVVVALAQGGAATVPQLMAGLRIKGVLPSVQGIYRVLRKLQGEGVIVKEKEHYTVRIPWILDISSFTQALEMKYVNGEYFQKLISLQEKSKTIWHFTDIYKLNDFWSQLISVLIKNSKEKILCNYHPHAWFYLIQMRQEYQYIKTSNKNLKKRYTLVGGNEYLDVWATKFWKDPRIQYFLAPQEQWLTQERATNISIIDDYVLTIKHEKKFANAIDNLYKTVVTTQELSTERLEAIFQKRTKGSIILQRNSAVALTYKKRFARLFGFAHPPK